jgi:hypothetical protein
MYNDRMTNSHKHGKGFQYCSDLARQEGIPLAGTAPSNRNWFLLEYNDHWDAQAKDNNHVPQPVLDLLKSPAHQAKLLFIRRDKKFRSGKLTFFMIRADPLQPLIFEFHLNSYLDLLELDLPSILSGSSNQRSHLRPEPLFLVCTNGRRDQCCARYGVELYGVMRESAGGAVWQCTHIGGHNKAPVTLFFPHGLNYGQTTPSEILHLMAEYRKGRVGQKHLRGRVCYQPAVQAAASYWRRETGNQSLPGFKLERLELISQNSWKVSLRDLSRNHTRNFSIELVEIGPEIPVSCDGKKIERISAYQVIPEE